MQASTDGPCRNTRARVSTSVSKSKAQRTKSVAHTGRESSVEKQQKDAVGVIFLRQKVRQRNVERGCYHGASVAACKSISRIVHFVTLISLIYLRLGLRPFVKTRLSLLLIAEIMSESVSDIGGHKHCISRRSSKHIDARIQLTENCTVDCWWPCLRMLSTAPVNKAKPRRLKEVRLKTSTSWYKF